MQQKRSNKKKTLSKKNLTKFKHLFFECILLWLILIGLTNCSREKQISQEAYKKEQAGKKAEALYDYTRALEINPDYAFANKRIGFILSESPESQDVAIHHLEMAKRESENDMEVMRNEKTIEYDELIDDGKTKKHFLSVKFPIRDENNIIIGVCVMANEITERKRAEEELKEAKDLAEAYSRELLRLSALDGLTKIANRRRFDEYLEEQWEIHLSGQLPLALIMIDIDYFKQYNDFYGHQSGDDCLIRIAQTIASVNNRTADLTSRYGGEEFVVILPNTNIEKASQIAESIRLSILGLAISHENSGVNPYITLSLGVASLVPSFSNLQSELITQADSALYKAKRLLTVIRAPL